MKKTYIPPNLLPINPAKSKKLLLVAMALVWSFLFSLEAHAQTTVTFDNPSANPQTWTVPAGVTSINVKLWGGGGAGGGTDHPNSGGGGGAGGSYLLQTLSVTPGSTISINVGAGGQGVIQATGNPGLASTVVYNSTTYTAEGGNPGLGGTGNNTGYAGGAALTIDHTYYGGAGANGTGGSGNISGAGGGGAGSGDNGDAGSGTTGGDGGDGDYPGGDGGDGRNTVGDGNSGSAPGGGGSGALGNDGTGGAGGDGQVIISFTCPTYSLTSTTATEVCAGSPSTVTLN